MRVFAGAAGLAGHTLPALALAGRLRERGHEVRFAGYSRWRAEAEALGLVFTGATEELVELPAGSGHAEVARSLAAEIADHGSDVVIGDGLTLTPGLAAELAGVPRVTLLPEVYPVSAPGLPPFPLGLRAPRTEAGAAFWRRLGPGLEAHLPATSWRSWARAELDRLRSELGLPPIPKDEPSVVAPLTLVATLPELEYPRHWPDGVHVTGPMFHDPEAPAVDPPPGTGPLVLVAPSTVKDPEGRLITAALAALAREPVRVLVTTGRGPAAPAAPPPNATVVEWLDFAHILPEASAVICHGNHGTVARALAEGVPLVVCPALADDAEHGARVAWAGAGAMIPARLLGEASMRAAVRSVLAQERFAAAAAAIRASARGRDGATTGAELVERYVAG